MSKAWTIVGVTAYMVLIFTLVVHEKKQQRMQALLDAPVTVTIENTEPEVSNGPGKDASIVVVDGITMSLEVTPKGNAPVEIEELPVEIDPNTVSITMEPVIHDDVWCVSGVQRWQAQQHAHSPHLFVCNTQEAGEPR